MDACSDWCCRLTGTESLRKETIQGFGIIVQFAGDLCASSRLPGLKKAGEIKSKYALLTCHSIIPGSEESFKTISWSMRSKATGSAKSPKLNGFVSGAISCCGEKSLFGPGEYSLREHRNRECDLGLDFTLLFLDSKFESYVKSNPPKCSPPIVTIPQSESHLLKLNEAIVSCGSDSKISSPLPIKERPKVSGTFFISLPTIDTDATNQLSCQPISVNPSKDPSMSNSQTKVLKLDQDISKYEALKCIKCTHIRDASVHRMYTCPGMPIAYQSASSGATAELTGILVQCPNGLVGITVYGIAQLIQGGPVGCLSVLINQAADRLWANRWSYLILPYLEEPDSLDTRHVLEILQVFLKKKLLRANVTDLLKTREAVLNLIGALFRHFKHASQDELMNAMEDAFGVADVKTGFLANLSSLCASVVENVNDANRYSAHQDTTQLVKNCFYCVAMMLNFNDKGGIVSGALKIESFLRTLEVLGEKYAKTASVQRDLASIQKKCLLDLQGSTQLLTTTHKQDVEKLQRDHAQTVKELEEKCRQEQDKLRKKEKECTTLSNLVKKEGARSSSAEKEIQKLTKEVERLHQCLASEQAVREREQRLSHELDEERTKNKEISEEIAKLKEEHHSSQDTIRILEDSYKKQSESAHRMQVELTQTNKTIHTQTQQLAETRKDKDTIIAELEKEKDAQTQRLEELERETNELQNKNEELHGQLKKSQQRNPRGYPTESLATPPCKSKTRKTSTPSPIMPSSLTSGKHARSTDSHTTTTPKQRIPMRSLSESRDVRARTKPSDGFRRTGSDSVVTKHSTRKKK